MENALRRIFPFELDDFQKEAIAALEAGQSVVVCAPTGSGKTLVGEYAIYRALARGNRVFYTTPLKALSNQKLRDFREQFGAEHVGLLTGDMSVNRDAPILVMTTEIFRNMLYGTSIGQVGTSLERVEAVVLDECHYMNDAQRGTVWEESIIYAPPEIQLVALSATVANSEQLTDWIQSVHGPTRLVYSDYRPIPLRYHFCNPEGLHPLLNQKGTALNPKLKRRGKQRGREKAASIHTVLHHLRKRDMLPAIYFIFSRRGCDRAVEEAGGLALVSRTESMALKEQIDAFLERSPEAARADQVEPLYRGIAAHHAGILPAWKAFVEELFQQGLIKVVFATETLAAGINMPARTTVISSLSKRTDQGHRLLNGSEFLQMAGRAGRRGMDDMGHVVTVQTRFEGAPEAAYLAVSGPDPLISQFTPSYSMVLNLLQIHTLEEARDLIEHSFGQYLATLHLVPQEKAIAQLEADIEHLVAQVAHVEDYDVLANFEKLTGRLKEERRLLKTLQQQARETQNRENALAISFALSGTLLSLKGKQGKGNPPLPAVLVAKVPGPGQAPLLITLGSDNRWYVVTAIDVSELYAEMSRLESVEKLNVPTEPAPKPGHIYPGSDDTGAIANQIPELPPPPTPPEVEEQAAKVAVTEKKLGLHPARDWGDPKKLLKRIRRIDRLELELEDRKSKLGKKSQRYWHEFLNLIAILQHFNCMNGVEPTSLGRIAAAIRGDNELWLAIAITSGEFEDLEPQQFAAVCAAMVTEVSRPELWTYYEPSPAIDLTLNSIRPLRRHLFQIQHRYQIAFPIWLEYEWISLVEQWALGEEWSTLCSNTSLDEGDIVRILRRTLDFLSQIPHVPHLPPSLYTTARQATMLLDRFPVNESTTKLNDLEDLENSEDETEDEPDELDEKFVDTIQADPHAFSQRKRPSTNKGNDFKSKK